MDVVATGMPAASANANSASCAREFAMPLPTTINGRCAAAISSTASRTPCGSGAGGRKRMYGLGSGRSSGISACWMSNGSSMTTGPGRPESAAWYARRNMSIVVSGRVTMNAFLVIGFSAAVQSSGPERYASSMPPRSNQWVAPAPAITSIAIDS